MIFLVSIYIIYIYKQRENGNCLQFVDFYEFLEFTVNSTDYCK